MVEHRPWPLPAGTWLMGQTWEDLLFAHWRVEIADLRPHLPDELEVDTFDGDAWVGVTPFVLSGLRLRGTLPVPVLSSFLELNVRTYVTHRGERPGIWFFSLDASSRLAVEAARRTYRLPYFHARMSFDGRSFHCARRGAERPRVFDGRYGPDGDAFNAEPGTLEHFLTERYCLYAHGDGRLWTADIHHPPWPLQPATAELALNTMPPDGVGLRGEPLLHLARRQDVLIWPLAPVA